MQRYIHQLFGWDYEGRKEQSQRARARQVKYETTQLIKQSTIRLKSIVKVNTKAVAPKKFKKSTLPLSYLQFTTL